MTFARPNWLAQMTEAALEPELSILAPPHLFARRRKWGRYPVQDLRGGMALDAKFQEGLARLALHGGSFDA